MQQEAAQAGRAAVVKMLLASGAEPLDCGGRFGHDEFHRLAIVETRAGDHRVVDMRLETVTRVEYGSDAALRPVGRPAVERALGQHQHLAILREVDGGRQSGGARTDDDDVMGGGGHISRSCCFCSTPLPQTEGGTVSRYAAAVRCRNTSSRSGSRVTTSTIDRPLACTALSTWPALARSLL